MNPEAGPEGDYLRILSHQLKSPIHAIQTLLNTISEGFAGGEESLQTRYLIERARDRASQAEEMISDLLDYEYFSHRESMQREEFDLLLLLNTLLLKYSSTASEKEVSLRSDIPREQKIFLLGDSRGMEHALRNLIENAIKYTPPQGSVTVAASLSEEKKSCEIRVSDTGYGIRSEELEHIFEPFYRSLKHKANVAGTGLGLAIVKRVVDNHGGSLSVDSRENEGSTFTVRFDYDKLVRKEEPDRRRRRVVIIGGVTAGPKAAARLRRLDEEVDITIVEKSDFLSYSGCGLPYYISGRVRSPKALMSTSDNTLRNVHFFETIKNITALNNTLAVGIEPGAKRIRVQDRKNGRESTLPYDTLILATGAKAAVPDIQGIDEPGVYTLYSMEDAEAIKAELLKKRAQDVFVVGGGLIGIGIAESLMAAGARVTILEKEATVLSSLMDPDMGVRLQREMNSRGIKILNNERIRNIRREARHLILDTEEESFSADLIILSLGVRANADLARAAGLEIGSSGGIRVDEHLQTSDENIYAVGDCAESVNLITRHHDYWPLGSISTKMGRIVADNIAGRATSFEGFIGSAMLRIFDINVARTGLTSAAAGENGYSVETAVVTGLDRAHYCDHAHHVTFKLLADKKSRVLLGAQGYGRGDVVSKIGILACAITRSMTLDDVFKLDLGYSPAFNNPIDVTQTACLVLTNKIDGLFRSITCEELRRQREAYALVDVSPLTEHTAHSIPGSINIPLENIRREELPFDKAEPAVLYSRTSSGAYEAYMYLASRGYTQLRVLEGGMLHWVG